MLILDYRYYELFISLLLVYKYFFVYVMILDYRYCKLFISRSLVYIDIYISMYNDIRLWIL